MLKHLAYRTYLQCWMGKLLQTHLTATVVDAFAGPGVYKDGPLGSPLMIADTYLNHSLRAKFGHLNIICQEERPDRVERLRSEQHRLPSAHGLNIDIQEPGRFNDRVDHLVSEARKRGAEYPVLWVLDPFNIESVQMVDLLKCLAGPKDEFILTFFVNEMHRLAGKNDNMSPALDRHFGSDCWRDALGVQGESNKKQAFIERFKSCVQSKGQYEVADFSIRVANTTPRYSLVLATHDLSGIDCWNKMSWKIDHVAGRGMHAGMVDQVDLFAGQSEYPRLEGQLRAMAGTEMTWNELNELTLRAGFKETHLRDVLTDLNSEGLAFRTSMLDKRTPWPSGCTVRFYEEEDLKEA